MAKRSPPSAALERRAPPPPLPGGGGLAVEWRPTGDVRPAPDNPRTIPPEAVAAVAESIRAFGWRQPLVIDREGVLIAGHTRLKAAELLGLLIVPVHVAADLSADEAAALRVIDNRSAEFSGWDGGKLKVALDAIPASLDVALGPFDFDALLASITPEHPATPDPAQATGPGGAGEDEEDTPARLRAKLERVVEVLKAARPAMQPGIARRADAALRFVGA